MDALLAQLPNCIRWDGCENFVWFLMCWCAERKESSHGCVAGTATKLYQVGWLWNFCLVSNVLVC